MTDDKTIFAEERRMKILEIIRQNQKTTVPELCKYFTISASTIRNDLRELEEKNLIRRTHGGAILKAKVQLEPLPSEKETQMIAQKLAIAEQAASLIEEGDTIALSTGTTIFELAKTLSRFKRLTIVVNDIRLAVYLEQYLHFSIYMIGGMIRNGFHYTCFTDVDSPPVFIDKIFFSCNGLTVDKGSTIPDISLARNEAALIRLSTEAILLCDNSKIGTVAFAQIAPLKNIHKIIIDSDANPNDIQSLRQSNTSEIIIAQVKN